MPPPNAAWPETFWLCPVRPCVRRCVRVQTSKSHAFGLRLMHSRSISRSRAGNLKSHAFVSSRVMFPASQPIAPTFEIFISSAEDSNPKLLHQMRFLGSQCLKNASAAGLCCPDPSKELTTLPKPPILDLRGRFEAEKGKGCERIGDIERKEGKEKWGMGWEERERGEREIQNISHFTVLSAWELCVCASPTV